jgi:hypothetical protein
MGKPKGLKKTGGATRGSVKTETLAVKEAVLKVFNEVNKDGEYLHRLSDENPSLFVSLVARMIPTISHSDINVSESKVDLTAAFTAAEQRIATLDAQRASGAVVHFEGAGKIADELPAKPIQWEGYET